MAAFGMPKNIIDGDTRKDINTHPIAKKYRSEIQEYLDNNFAKGGKMFVPQGREILYQDENVALQHNNVTDSYSMINPETGLHMEKGGKIKIYQKPDKGFVSVKSLSQGDGSAYDRAKAVIESQIEWDEFDKVTIDGKEVTLKEFESMKDKFYSN